MALSTQLEFPNPSYADAGTHTLTEAEKAEIRRLRSTCSLYDLYRPDWEFNLSAYEGGSQFINQDNIFKHAREHDEDYKDRLKRAHYMNYCEPLVEFFSDFIFAETIDRHGGNNADFYTEFISDVNRKGESITEFMKEVCSDDQIYGLVYVLVDSPAVPEGQRLTRAQEKALKIRPYWILVKPQDVLDWVVDEFDHFTYWKRFQLIEDMSTGSRRTLEKYTEWTPLAIKISLIDVSNPQKPRLLPATIIGNKIGEVPVVPIRYKRSKRYKEMGEAFLKDLAMQNREVMNLTSLLQEFLYRQCFNILAVQVDTQLPTQEQSEGEIGTANMLHYPKGAEAPAYISPSSDPADKIHEERQTIVNEMYKRAAQDTVNELFNGVKRSGFSQAQSFSTTVPRIASRAETLEKAENRLMDLTMKYMGKTWDGRVKYKDRYELTNITDALSQLTQLFTQLQMPSETFVKTELKRMVKEFDGKIPADILLKIEAEIDAMKFSEWQETMKTALIGAPKTNDGANGSATRKPTTTAEAKSEATKGKG